MPIGEIAGEALGGLLRVVGRLLFEIFFELMIQGAGYWLLRRIRPGYEPSRAASGAAGLLFWTAIAAAGFWLYMLASD
jgi:hypothetical protein